MKRYCEFTGDQDHDHDEEGQKRRCSHIGTGANCLLHHAPLTVGNDGWRQCCKECTDPIQIVWDDEPASLPKAPGTGAGIKSATLLSLRARNTDMSTQLDLTTRALDAAHNVNTNAELQIARLQDLHAKDSEGLLVKIRDLEAQLHEAAIDASGIDLNRPKLFALNFGDLDNDKETRRVYMFAIDDHAATAWAEQHETSHNAYLGVHEIPIPNRVGAPKIVAAVTMDPDHDTINGVW